jgi:hypothetical protein
MTVPINQSPLKLKPAEAMPGRYGLPFLGETLSIFGDEELYYWQHFQRYGSVFKTRILGQKFAFLVGPEANHLCCWNRQTMFPPRWAGFS